MKHVLTSIFILFCMVIFAQSREHAGNYELTLGGDKSYTETNKLTLNPNGTFLFKYNTNFENDPPNSRIQYGKGTWTSDKRLIFLKVEDTDVDASHVLNLDNSKLRYDTKSPRDKSDRDIKTSVRFYESDIPWMKGRTLLKKE